MIGRRHFLAGLGAALVARSGSPVEMPPGIKIATIAGDLTDGTLKFSAQLGIEWIDLATRPGLVPPPGRPPQGRAQRWNEVEVRAMVDRVRSYGLKPGIRGLPAYPNVLLGNTERDRDIEVVQDAIRIAGRLGIPTLEYNFLLLRASAGYYQVEGRGGAGLRAFDAARVKDYPPVGAFGNPSREEVWSRLEYFLEAIVPVAEKAGVRLSIHPNDPPLESFGGAAQPMRSVADLKRVIEVVDSPSNGITLDTGVTRQMGEDVVETIRYFGRRDRINHVHFRNVNMHEPYVRYTESFHDDGDVDMLAAMRAFVEVGYRRLMVPDHTPLLSIDGEKHYAGWAYAIGYMKALLKAAVVRRP
jgi:mannonate dehydratase